MRMWWPNVISNTTLWERTKEKVIELEIRKRIVWKYGPDYFIVALLEFLFSSENGMEKRS